MPAPLANSQYESAWSRSKNAAQRVLEPPRRLVESGVRFVQVYSDGEWDAHADLAGNHSAHCAATDAPIDALLTRDFASFEDALAELAERGFVLRAG